MKNQKLRYGNVCIILMLFISSLLIMWPVLPATISAFLLVNFCISIDEKDGIKIKKYTHAKTALYIGLTLMFAFPAILFVYDKIFNMQEYINFGLDEIHTVYSSCINNIVQGRIFSNFGLYLKFNITLLFIYAVVAFFITSFLFFLAETGNKKARPNRHKTLRPTAEIKKPLENGMGVREAVQNFKCGVKRNCSGILQLFILRPRVLIFLVINYLLFWYRVDFPMGFNIASLLEYIIVIALSLSGVAEWVFRKFEDIRHVATLTEKERLTELFCNVKSCAMKYSRMIDEKTKLYIADSMTINAFSIGRHTIVITRGLMEAMNDEELEAIIAHEMAHIMNGDTQVGILITIASNIYIWCILLTTKLLHFIETMAGGNSFIGSLFSFIRNILEAALKYVILAINILVSSGSRKAEYKADKLAFELGYGEALLSALYNLYNIEISNNKKLIDRMQATHPKVALRIEALEKMCCEEYQAEIDAEISSTDKFAHCDVVCFND